MKITAEILCAIVSDLPCQKAYVLEEALNNVFVDAQISSPNRLYHFLAQLLHESGGFKFSSELGSKKYFDRYEGRTDLGNVVDGDGYRFRGRGWIQLTGRANYHKAAEALGIPLEQNPDLAEKPRIAAKIAAWYWITHDCNRFADENDIRGVTLRVNGGLNGLKSRESWFKVAQDVMEGYSL